MNPTLRSFLTLALAAAMALPANAYDAVVTHKDMTVIATKKTALYTDPSIMFALGFALPPDQQRFNYHARTGTTRNGTTNYYLPEFLAEGSIEEDDPFTRVFHHFYDPVHNRPLTVGAPLGAASWAYMLEPNPMPFQDNSLKDARFYLEYGLMNRQGTPMQAYQQRLLSLTWLLRSLGHAMHHMQDMAQPQHVRNDQHLSYVFDSRYEEYTKNRNADLLAYMESGAPVYPGSADFKTAKDFWFNDQNTGISQFVNNNFLSHGTTFKVTDAGVTTGAYALPPPVSSKDYTVAELGVNLLRYEQAVCDNPVLDCRMTMWATPMTERATTLSIFDQDLRAHGVDVVFDWDNLGFRPVTRRFFDLNFLNFDAVHPVLIPRAVSYSAGIVNHFFRGKLEVTKPETGPYSVVDHSRGDGFRKVRMTVKNVTPGEALSQGTIRLIAKYHLNNCYKPDLTGEFRVDGAGQAIEPCPNYRSPEQYVSISAPQSADFPADGDPKQMTFMLDTPIPVNATDLMFQVYFSGKVGTEEESFALGAVDVSEPTFMAEMNGTDTFALAGSFYYYQHIIDNIAVPPFNAIDIDESGTYNPPEDVNVNGGSYNFDIYINNLKVADAPVVPEGRFTRLALIVDLDGYDHKLSAGSAPHHFPAKELYWDYETSQMRVIGVNPLRNHTLQFNSTTIWRYHPTPAGVDIATMPKSLATDAEIAFPLVLTSTVAPSAVMSAPPVASSSFAMDALRDAALARMWQMPEQEPTGMPVMSVPTPGAVAVTGPALSVSHPLPPAR